MKVIASTVAITLLVCTACDFPTLLTTSKNIRNVERCLRYAPAPQQVVYDETPQNVATMRGTPGVSVVRELSDAGSFDAAIFEPAQVSGASLLMARHTMGQKAGLFMHELRTRAGRRRLVVVERQPDDTQPLFAPLGLDVMLFEPQEFDSTLRRISDPPNRRAPAQFVCAPHRHHAKRFYAGQVDPHDASRFTIGYAIDEAPGAIDGQLLDDGSWVHLSVRDGPAASPSHWSRPLLPDP